MSAQGRPKGESVPKREARREVKSERAGPPQGRIGPEARSAEGSQVSAQGRPKDDFVPKRGAQGTIR